MLHSLAVVAQSLESGLTLCDPLDCSLPGSSEHGILQARIPQWVAMPSTRDLPDSGIEPAALMSPASAGVFFTASTSQEAPSLS